MARTRLLAFLGIGLLVLGLFAPVASMPIVGSVNLFHNGDDPLGLAIIATALVALCLTLGGASRWLLAPGITALGIVVWWFIRFRRAVAEIAALGKDSGDSIFGNLANGIASAAAATMQVQWGIVVPAAGALLIVAAAFQSPEPVTSEGEADVDQWGYQKLSPWTMAAIAIAVLSVLGFGFYAIKHNSPSTQSTTVSAPTPIPTDDTPTATAPKENHLGEFVSVEITSKTFESGDYQDYISLRETVTNLGTKDIRGFKGHLVFTDLFGDKIDTYSMKEDDGIAAGATKHLTRYYRYNQFMDADIKMKSTALTNMHVEWVPETILFKDGSQLQSVD